MAKKSGQAEIDRRIHAVVKLLSSAKTNSYILRFCTEEWGVQKRQAETYLQRAREIIRADYSVERSDFLGTRLALLDEIIEASHSLQATQKCSRCFEASGTANQTIGR